MKNDFSFNMDSDFTNNSFKNNTSFDKQTSDGGNAITISEDPFGGDYDPFSSNLIKESDKFSWDDEPDPFLTDSGIDTIDTSTMSLGKATAALSNSDLSSPISNNSNNKNLSGSHQEFSNIFKDINSPSENSNFLSVNSFGNNANNNTRSKSVTGDPMSILQQVREIMPQRSKTALGEPGLDLDFDPFSTSKTNENKKVWKSNEDLLNEAVGSNAAYQKTQNNSSFLSSNNINNNRNNSLTPNLQNNMSESEQIAWASEQSLKEQHQLKCQDAKESEDLKLALALSKSMMSKTSRSPATGL